MFTLDWHRLNFTSGSNNATGVRKDKSQGSLRNFLLGAGNEYAAKTIEPKGFLQAGCCSKVKVGTGLEVLPWLCINALDRL